MFYLIKKVFIYALTNEKGKMSREQFVKRIEETLDCKTKETSNFRRFQWTLLCVKNCPGAL